MKKDSLRAVLAALTLTLLLATALVVFYTGKVRSAEAAAQDRVALVEAENAQLRQTIQQMQFRETDYRAQIEQANTHISELMTELGMRAEAP